MPARCASSSSDQSRSLRSARTRTPRLLLGILGLRLATLRACIDQILIPGRKTHHRLQVNIDTEQCLVSPLRECNKGPIRKYQAPGQSAKYFVRKVSSGPLPGWQKRSRPGLWKTRLQFFLTLPSVQALSSPPLAELVFRGVLLASNFTHTPFRSMTVKS